METKKAGKKGKLVTPRHTWPMKPFSRVKENAKIYNRKRQKKFRGRGGEAQ